MKKRSAPRGRERRASERAEARLSMRVEAAATGIARIVTESQNISASGVYCHSSQFLAPLSKVQLTIVLPRTPGADAVGHHLVKCDGIVVRCDQREGEGREAPYELACMFTALEPGMRERIEQFVTWRNLRALRAALGAAGKGPRPTRAGAGTARKAAANAAEARNGVPLRTATRAPGAARRKAAKRSPGRAQH